MHLMSPAAHTDVAVPMDSSVARAKVRAKSFILEILMLTVCGGVRWLELERVDGRENR